MRRLRPTPPADPAAPAATDDDHDGGDRQVDADRNPGSRIRAEELIGTTVYGADDDNIGEISDIVLTEDGKVDADIIDVGGFLGIGEKPVAVGIDKLAFMTDKDGKKYLYTNFTKEQLEAQPAYDKATYAEKRDEQRLMM